MKVSPSKMLRLLRAATAKGTAEFARPLKKNRGAIEGAENGRVKEVTVKKLIRQALTAFVAEIPDFLAEEASRMLGDAKLSSSPPSLAGASTAREIQIRGVDRMGREETKGSIVATCPSPQAFGVIVSDAALETEIRKGSLATLDPSAPLTEGALVGAMLKHGAGIVVRRYSRLPGVKPKILLTSRHPDEYPVLNFEPKTGAEWIYPVFAVITQYSSL